MSRATALRDDADLPVPAPKTEGSFAPPVAPVAPGSEQAARLRAERLELARELHDVVGSAHTMITLQAWAAERLVLEHPSQAVAALTEIRRASAEVMHELREILGGLRSPTDIPAGTGRIDSLVEWTARAGIPTRLTVTGRRRLLPTNVHLAAYRIIQESLTNVVRHSSASAASVLVEYATDRLIVEVEDDGIGPGESAGPGYGILGMRERVVALGGELEAGLRSEGGFRVHATLPLRTVH
jgi:signal transduction histidine kinase